MKKFKKYYKIAFIGGMKSGKSRLAEDKILSLSQNTKPIYLATTEFIDKEMEKRIKKHKENRADRFHTIEEAIHIDKVISESQVPVLIECLSMWINNMLYHKKSEDEIITKVTEILKMDKSIIFVLNDVGGGIIPENPLARQFIDISGQISQLLGEFCDEVYYCVAGLLLPLKKEN